MIEALYREMISRFVNMEMKEYVSSDIVNNGWHIYLKDICTYATLSKVS